MAFKLNREIVFPYILERERRLIMRAHCVRMCAIAENAGCMGINSAMAASVQPPRISVTHI